MVIDGAENVFSLFVDPDISPGVMMGIEVAYYQRILGGRCLVEEKTVDMKRGVSVRMILIKTSDTFLPFQPKCHNIALLYLQIFNNEP